MKNDFGEIRMAEILIVKGDIPNLIPININFDTFRSHGILTMNYPILVKVRSLLSNCYL